MHIEIWSDYVCPFCYIGKERFNQALKKFEHRDDVTVEMKSFQLDPTAGKYNGENYYEVLGKKFGSAEQAKQMTKNIQEQANTVGLNFDFDNAKHTNTLDAHRLNKFALSKGNDALAEKMFQAHFVDGLDVGDFDTLKKLAADAGLDADEALEVLQDPSRFKEAVETDISEASQFGISGVPYFIINRKYAVSGAQPEEAFTNALKQIWEEENKQAPVLKDLSAGADDAAACTDDNCDIPSNK